MPLPVPVHIAGTMLPYQFHQVAMFLPDACPMANALATYESLGFYQWLEDRATLRGYYRTNGVWQPSEVQAHMVFNYDTMPMELEFLKYGMGSLHRHGSKWAAKTPFISHMSTYVDDVIEAIQEMRQKFGLPFHRFVTQNHTNPGVLGKKRFIEAIFDTQGSLGYDLKLIQKVPWDYNDNDYLEHDIWK